MYWVLMKNQHNLFQRLLYKSIEVQKNIEGRYKVCSVYLPCMPVHVRKRGIQLAQAFCIVLIGIAFQQSMSAAFS